MISAAKALHALRDAGLIGEWQRERVDASFDEGGSLMETQFRIEPAPDGKKLTVDNEVYGKRAFLYFRCQSEEIAAIASTALKMAGGEPDFRWYPGNDRYFDMRVSYFKGCRWWE